MHRTIAVSVLAAALTLGGVAPAFAEEAPPASAPVLVAPPAPAVQGRFRDGSTLRVTVDGLQWGVAPESVAVQWQRDGVPVVGATAPRYRLGAADVDHEVRAHVTATAGGASVAVDTAGAAVQPGRTSERRLSGRLSALLKTLPGRYTLRVAELEGGRRTVSIGADRHREPASVSKLFVAYGVLTRIDQGRLRWSDRLDSGLSVRSCMRAMIEPSDNYCATDLRLRIGTRWLDRLLHSHGLTGTTFWYDGQRTKTTTTADVTTLLTRLARGGLVSKRSTAALVRLLETHVWREAIPPGLPDGVRQASKPGCLYTATGWVQTDAAIVWGERSTYVLTVMGSDGATTGAITRISRLVHDELQGRGGRAFRYDRQQMRATGRLVLTASAWRGSHVLGRYGSGTRVEVVDSIRTRYLVRIAGRVGWIDNTHLTLRHPIL